MIKKISLSILFISVSVFSQKIPVEILLKPKSAFINTGYNRYFSEDSKFGIFALANINIPYDAKDDDLKGQNIQINSFYSATKSLSLFTGFYSKTTNAGFSLGARNITSLKNGLLFLSYRNALSNKFTSEFIVNFEYKPKLTETLQLYTRITVFAETNFQKYLSGVQIIRLGVHQDNINYGLGANIDAFDKTKTISVENFGVFARVEL
jgi:hypothetical protein